MVDIRYIVSHDVLTFETDGYAMPVYEFSNILIRYCLSLPPGIQLYSIISQTFVIEFQICTPIDSVILV